ncbi:hypothetical protein I316_00002 [Kwoniella heveanensis BCC8398]|uniref:Uncharacterized protein n=1 Tax=Kwoniella heveanensis BCC8398 TaxID=1296120 RepID=A0A1B9H3E5_9TREE|nr:hypothetical protein I316_00002 [Kwoniella heveanensis BCC8398]
MPRFLKSLFKPSSGPRHPHHQGQRDNNGPDKNYEIQIRPSPSSPFSAPDISASSPHDDLLNLLEKELQGQSQDRKQIERLQRSLEKQRRGGNEEEDETLRRLIKALQEIDGPNEARAGGSEPGKLTLNIRQQGNDDVASGGQTFRRKYKDKAVDRLSQSSSKLTGRKERLLDPVIRGCSVASESGEKLLHSYIGKGPNGHLVERVIALLEAQRDELSDIAPYTGRRRYPALVTLEQIYEKVEIGLESTAGMTEAEAKDNLVTLVQVLQEGPDYLIDIILIQSIIHHASIISIPFSIEICDVLHRAIDDQSDLYTFRRGAESIIAIASALDRDLLEDKECLEAYKIIGVLVKQLQVRLASSVLPTPKPSVPATPSGLSTPSLDTPTPLTLPPTPTPKGSIPPSPSTTTLSSASTVSAPASPVFKAMTTSELQSAYGTGQSTPATSKPLPGLSSYNATPSTSKAPTPSSGAKVATPAEGQLLTRSALDLVLRQETLAQADSSGQWAGEVSWDDLRKAWIPHYVEKLKVSDLADGEVPDTTPAGFKTKQKDAWGNKIGFYGPNKEMYYKEEPKWELPD